MMEVGKCTQKHTEIHAYIYTYSCAQKTNTHTHKREKKRTYTHENTLTPKQTKTYPHKQTNTYPHKPTHAQTLLGLQPSERAGGAEEPRGGAAGIARGRRALIMQPPNAVEAAKTLTPFNYANYAGTPGYRRGHGHRRFPLQEFPRLFVPAPKKNLVLFQLMREVGGGERKRGGGRVVVGRVNHEGRRGGGSRGKENPRGKRR